MSDIPEVEDMAGVPAEHPEEASARNGSTPPPAGPEEQEGGEETEEDRLVIASEDALDFVDGLLDAMDVDGDASAEVRDGRVYVSVEGADSALLIGHHGQTLEAIQELMRSAIQRQVRSRVLITLDVQGYRERRRESLQERARELAARVLDEGEMEFEPMNAFERKVIHDAIGEIEGVTSFSEGEEPYRRVVIAPAED
ncbi:MAG TPA: R3H domain-containing nucleic acid-binding protein [Actinomycetota bacterium]|nr:R3H domain-containing nucleic acid-binding protein [Actinomycetota bacterium]